MSNYTRWYRDGTIGATNGSTEITGSGTYWKSAGLNPGDMLEVGNSGVLLEIASINSDTSITLARPYSGNTVTDAAYAIVRNFTATMPSKIAAQTAELLGDFRKYIDTDMDRLTGKSAYEIAKLHGFTGTEAAWLESLKAAGEWTTLNNRTNILTYNNAGSHNSIYRGKNLGTAVTASQIANIKNTSFNDIYPGDFWRLPIDGTTTAHVAGCNVNLYRSMGLRYHIIAVLHNSNWTFSINDTATCEGHFMNSKMYTEHLPYILAKVKEVIPEEYILTFHENIGDSINSDGNKNHIQLNVPVQIGLPSYTNISGIYNADYNKNSAYSISSTYIWPIYRHSPEARRNLMWAWINESHSKTNWNVLNWAIIPTSTAANATTYEGYTLKVVPYILLG